MDSKNRQSERLVKKGIDDHTALLEQIRNNTVNIGDQSESLMRAAGELHNLNKILPKIKGDDKARVRAISKNLETVIKYNQKSGNIRALLAKEGGFVNAARIAKLGISQVLLNKLAKWNIDSPSDFKKNVKPMADIFESKMNELIDIMIKQNATTKKALSTGKGQSDAENRISASESIRERANALRKSKPVSSGSGIGGTIGSLVGGAVALVGTGIAKIATGLIVPFKKLSTIVLSPLKAMQGVSGAIGGALVGLLGKIGGGLSLMGAGLRGFMGAAGGVAVFGALLLAIGGATWLFGSGVDKIGTGLSGIADGIKKFNGIDIDQNKMKAAAEGMGTILTGISGWDNLGGAVVSMFVSPNGINGLVDNINKMNNLNVDKEKIIQASDAIKTVLTSLSGSAGLVGAITSNIVDTKNIEKIADSLNYFNNVSIDREKIIQASGAIGAVLTEMGTWKSFWGSITSNFIDNDNLQRLAVSLKTFGGLSIERGNVDNVTYALSQIGDGLNRFPTRALASFMKYLTGENPFTLMASGLTAFAQIPDIAPEKANNLQFAMLAIGKGMESISLYDVGKLKVSSGVLKDSGESMRIFSAMDGDRIVSTANGMTAISTALKAFADASLASAGKSFQETLLSWFGGSTRRDRTNDMLRTVSAMEAAGGAVGSIVKASENYSAVDRMSDSLVRLSNVMGEFNGVSKPFNSKMGDFGNAIIAQDKKIQERKATESANRTAALVTSIASVSQSTVVNNNSAIVVQETAIRTPSLSDIISGRSSLR